MAINPIIDRRTLLSGGAAAALGLAAFGRSAVADIQTPRAKFLSAARIDGVDGGALLNGTELSAFALPARAHAMARLSSSEIVMVGRRPGMFAAIVDPAALDGEDMRLFAPAPAHRFAGHAAVNERARTLVTSEFHEETAQGALGLRDSSTGKLRALLPAGGIEPHDVLFARGGEILVAAIGGIAKAADVYGSPTMNAGRIESSIVEMDARSGAILKRHAIAHMPSLSLRHMALAPDGETIAFGMQDQDRSQARPLVGLFTLGGDIELLPLPEDGHALRSYIGSIAFDVSGRFIAATSPKGGMLGLWSRADGRWLDGLKLTDVCGLAPAAEAGAFWATTGLGDVVHAQTDASHWNVTAHWRAPAAFDNHLLKV